MKTKELRGITKEELLEKKKECEFLISSSYTKVKPKIKPERRKGVKITIARINTILNEREKLR